MKRIALFALLCLGLTSIPAMAAVPPFPPIIFSTNGPELPSPVGFAPFGPASGTNPIPSVAWDCPASSCNVTAIGFWDFNTTNGTPYTPTAISTVGLGNRPFFQDPNTVGFTGPIQQTGCLHGVTLWCFEYIDIKSAIGHDVTAGAGVNWITLSGELLATPGIGTAWSNADGTGSPSLTLSLNPRTGLITGYPSDLAFTVYGSAVPEPSSMMLLGTGVLGLAGVLRRKLMP